jgi:tripartite-type tricarboxylate transporter receptor subunit TctC
MLRRNEGGCSAAAPGAICLQACGHNDGSIRGDARMMRRACLFATAVLAALVPQAASAQADYFAGKTVRMIIGLGPGGGYDLWARLITRHLGKHLPGNPTVIAQNMEGAGSFRAANHMQSVAPRDGTMIALIARDAPLGPITGNPGAQFDPTKFSWLGTTTTETNVCLAYKTAAVKTVQDLMHRELLVGDNGPGTGTGTYPRALNALLGTRFKPVRGYKTSVDVQLAMERGEVEGYCESLESVLGKRPDWISSGTVNVLLQGGAAPHPDLKSVPFVPNLAKNADDRKAIEFLYAGQGIGRPFFAPPGVSPQVLRMLRDGFNRTMTDPEFMLEVRQRKLTLAPENGEALEALIARIYATPKPIVDRIANVIK